MLQLSSNGHHDFHLLLLTQCKHATLKISLFIHICDFYSGLLIYQYILYITHEHNIYQIQLFNNKIEKNWMCQNPDFLETIKLLNSSGKPCV